MEDQGNECPQRAAGLVNKESGSSLFFLSKSGSSLLILRRTITLAKLLAFSTCRGADYFKHTSFKAQLSSDFEVLLVLSVMTPLSSISRGSEPRMVAGAGAPQSPGWELAYLYPQAVQVENVNFSPSRGAGDSRGIRENGSPRT